MKKTKLNLSFLIIITIIFGSLMHCSAQSERTNVVINDWKFKLVDNNIDYLSLTNSQWEDVTIPHTWNNNDIQSGEKVHYGTAFYKTELFIDTTEINSQYFLRFEGVGQQATLYINNIYVGEHLGSYSAFVFNITSFLRNDTVNTVLLKVNNELNNSYPKDNFLFGIFGGIYRPVSLITTSDMHVALTDFASSGVYVFQENVNTENASLKIVTNLKNETSAKCKVVLKQQLISAQGQSIAGTSKEHFIFPGGIVPVNSYLNVKNPHLWNGKDDPYLYRLETKVLRDGKVIDHISQSVGIRFFSIDPELGFILNGEPYRLYGVCRHQEWEDMGNALLPEYHKKDMELINEIGATSIRLAHYQQAEYIYSLADSMGFLIWAEIPFVNGYKEDADANAEQQLIELIKQNFNHPSIFVWGLHNEVVKNGKSTEPANLTRKLHNISKLLDPYRFTVSVSNIWWVHDHEIHELADLQGFNQYTGWYGGKPHKLKNWIDSYHKSKPDVRFSVSEYGAGGNVAHQSSDISFPVDPKSSFFSEHYQTYYHEQTWAAIESSPFVWGSYVWNMFDFSVPEWDRGGIKGRNHKGLITYDRKTKKDAFYWYKANWSEEPVLYLSGKRNNISDTNSVNINVYSNYGVPNLFVDGKSYGELKQGINSVHFVYENLNLEPGKHKIEIKNGSLRDEVEVIINQNHYED